MLSAFHSGPPTQIVMSEFLFGSAATSYKCQSRYPAGKNGCRPQIGQFSF
uniref:Uncharacterized protein n=1 Tax=Anguilla anguilla TaxID=7936 RepID=A0A0E9QPM0_ANGAN